MITEYHRPQNIQEALKLLSREDPVTVPLGGGTILSRFSRGQVEVVDLQMLKLDKISKKSEFLSIGSTATLQMLMDYTDTPICLKESLLFEGTHHLRQVATVGGTLLSANGDSLFSALVLACNAEMQWEPDSQLIPFEKWLLEPKSWNRGKLLVDIHLLFESVLKYEKISLTPRSKPELFVAKAVEGKQIRYVLGGKCKSFHLFDVSVLDNKRLSEFLEHAYSDFNPTSMSQPYFNSSVNVLLKRLDLK